jgi:hypothetical protein
MVPPNRTDRNSRWEMTAKTSELQMGALSAGAEFGGASLR